MVSLLVFGLSEHEWFFSEVQNPHVINPQIGVLIAQLFDYTRNRWSAGQFAGRQESHSQGLTPTRPSQPSLPLAAACLRKMTMKLLTTKMEPLQKG